MAASTADARKANASIIDAGETDFLIIGSGSAGSALAWRLGEDGSSRVTVLEYGGSDAGPFIQMPAALSYPMNMASYDWGYRAEPEPALGGRSLVCPRGKVIGGSSSINGMIFVRGHAGDYAHWAEQGAEGWDYASVLPYFRRMETAHLPEDAASAFRGGAGPLHVTRGSRANPLHHAFVAAAEQAGYAATADYNGFRQEGFGPADMTVWQGRRWSAANAYLRPALRRGNTRLITRALVWRVEFEGRRAVAVLYRRRGRLYRLRAHRGIVLAAGAIGSPLILQHSGIGPARLLADLGIPVVAARAGVGGNLQDHLEVYFQIACLQPVTLYRYMNPLAKACIGLRWLLTRGGPGASNHFETLGFIRSQAGVGYPDIQFHFLPVAIRYDGTAPAAGHGFQLHVGPMRSGSRGHVRLRSADPLVPPEIRFNYMSEAEDWAAFRRCLRLSREILGQSAFAAFHGGEIQPGEAAVDDAALDAFVRDHAESAYHPCGTARMGRVDDPLAVVDPLCRVIGVEGLWCADSSVFPRITNGNLNAPSVMTGEKAADHILGRQPLAPLNLAPWYAEDWKETQR